MPAWRAGGMNALDYLMRGAGDDAFPALSGTVSEINQIVADESESANKLTKAILQDFALTNKLLKLVNTVSYGQFGGKINTISKAVVILGFETVRNVAMTLILLEFLHNKSQAAQLKDEVIASVFAGLVATRLCRGRNVRDSEEAMICAMFLKLGQLLCLYYFFEESQQIAGLVAQGMDEARAAQQVLGISYDELGLGIARHWCFPDRLLAGMKKLPAGTVAKPRSELDHLNLTVNLANELCTLAASTSPEHKQEALHHLAQRYEPAAPISLQQLDHALEHGLQEIALRSAILNLPSPSRSPVLTAITQWSDHAAPEPAEDSDNGMDGITPLDTATHAVAEADDLEDAADPETILAAGIQDVTNTLVGQYRLNDVMQMVLETMYRAMRFNRMLIFVRDAKGESMRARFGFGNDIDTLLPQLHFPLKFAPDVFHVALEKGVDVVIEDVTADNIASKIPAWYRNAVPAECFLLLPVMINHKALGLLYADMQAASSLQLTQRQLGLLRTLRNQIVLAIRQGT